MVPRALYKLCNEFERLAELSVAKVSVVENSDPILKEISNKKSFDDRVAIAEEHFEKLGEGSARTIFKVSDKLVLKIAHNDKGIVQNLAEMKPQMQRACTNHVVAADVKGKWILVRFTENLTKEEFEKYVGIKFSHFTDALFYKFNNESDNWPPPKDYDEIRKSELFKCIVDLVADCDLQIGDIDKPDSWGLLDGKVILRDYGLTREVYNKYYDESSSKSKSS
jgi:hypothetical protein